MATNIKLDGKDYRIDQLSRDAKLNLVLLKFATERITELQNNGSLLKRAKDSYMKSLKKEMLANKAGFLFEDN